MCGACMCQCSVSVCVMRSVLVFALALVGAAADCGVVSKEEWEGLVPVQVSYLARPVQLVIIQHTVTPTCSSRALCAELVRNIQTNHVDVLNYPDIGPSFLVGGDGAVYEGAGWLHVGSHTYGYNSRSIGVAFIGNYNNDEPTSAMLEAVRSLLRCGVERGHLSPEYRVVAHSKLLATQSPGRKLYNKIRRWPEYLDDVDSIKNT